MEDRSIAFGLAFVGGVFQAFVALYLLNLVIQESDKLSVAGAVVVSVATFGGSISVQVSGAIGLLLSLFVFAGSILMLKDRTMVRGSSIVVVCSVLNFPFTLSGGVIGLLFGLVGGLWGRASTKPDYSA